jgi:hypothetical protein
MIAPLLGNVMLPLVRTADGGKFELVLVVPAGSPCELCVGLAEQARPARRV